MANNKANLNKKNGEAELENDKEKQNSIVKKRMRIFGWKSLYYYLFLYYFMSFWVQ